jgi:hypothetical protein
MSVLWWRGAVLACAASVDPKRGIGTQLVMLGTMTSSLVGLHRGRLDRAPILQSSTRLFASDVGDTNQTAHFVSVRPETKNAATGNRWQLGVDSNRAREYPAFRMKA